MRILWVYQTLKVDSFMILFIHGNILVANNKLQILFDSAEAGNPPIAYNGVHS